MDKNVLTGVRLGEARLDVSAVVILAQRQKTDSYLLRDRPADIPVRLELAGFAFILALTLVLRLLNISDHSLWLDEGITLIVAQAPVSTILTTPMSVHPPLYYLAANLFLNLGETEFHLRLSSAVFGTLTMIPVYLIARRFAGAPAALAAGLVLATSTIHVAYSQEARPYALLCFWLGLNAHAFMRMTDEVGGAHRFTLGKAMVLYVFTGIAALYTHLIAAFFLLSINIAGLMAILSRPYVHGRTILILIVPGLVIALMALPWLQFVQGASQNFNWLNQTRPLLFLNTMLDINFTPRLWTLADIGMWLLIGAGLAIALRRSKANLSLILFGMIVMYPIMIWLAGYVYRPVFMVRTVTPLLMGTAVAVGIAVALLRPGWLAAGALVLAVGTSAVSIGLHRDVRTMHDWRAVASYLDQVVSPDDAIVICARFNYTAYRYYNKNDVAIFAAAKTIDSIGQIDDKSYVTEKYQPIPVRRATDAWAKTLDRSFPSWTELQNSLLKPFDRVWRVDFQCTPQHDAVISDYLAQSGFRFEDSKGVDQMAISRYVAGSDASGGN